ncbi:MAG TPA: 4a-hydroxytetrahydrobiopterin dehydratase [Sandaracinaceae bacterium]
MTDVLSSSQIEEALAGLSGWRHEAGALKKRFTFAGFPEAIAFITRIAFEAERLGHHPELRNVYDTVEIALTTHDANDRVTALDVELARRIEAALRT